MKTPRHRSGICKLTQLPGDFIDSHLIPKALTKPGKQGTPFFQLGPDGKLVRRWSSWYDPKLVTRKGEDILSELDTWAILELRKHKLIWSSWGSEKSLPSNLFTKIGETDWGVRKIVGIDPNKLRLFLLSLLWRAAATELSEFRNVELAEADVETLRQMLISRSSEPLFFFPVTLTQLSTLGPIHNQAPHFDLKRVPNLSGIGTREEPIIRFYFDGLIVHFSCKRRSEADVKELGNLLAGIDESLLITTQTYDNSFQRILLKEQFPWN
jgi:hypothetical protein